ncbi:tetratricopeptide repeat protein [Streptomyces sp. NPDC047023]|uniref:tetratricopeptide repeat protein n=1 Tax=Streptomyces sp. NPDC047023 TaxID=3155139 RepID=UPI003402BA6D
MLLWRNDPARGAAARSGGRPAAAVIGAAVLASALALAFLWAGGAGSGGARAAGIAGGATALTALLGLAARLLRPRGTAHPGAPGSGRGPGSRSDAGRGPGSGRGPRSGSGADGLLRTPGGRIPPLRRVDRPEQAGVHPAGAGRSGEPAPAYVRRDAEPRLREALGRSGFVLLVGESTAGTSRLAYEVARSLYPRHAFVRPLSRAALPAALRAAARRRRSVLWLDDLDDFLGAGGLTAALLAGVAAAPGRRIVLATLRTQEFRRFHAREKGRLTGSDRDAWRIQREVLERAEVVRLALQWSAAERHRAAAGQPYDPRIGEALLAGEGFGVAEVLAAGPERLAAWQEARAPGAHPRGAAVVSAAVDCRRAGLRGPVGEDLLRALHRPYLPAQGADPPPEPFSDALDWAVHAAPAADPPSPAGHRGGAGSSSPVGHSAGAAHPGAAAAPGAAGVPAAAGAPAASPAPAPAPSPGGLLAGDRARGYTAFGYLLTAPGAEPVPDHLWRTLLTRVTAEQAYDLGLLAHQEGHPRRAAEALTRAALGRVPGADFLLALALGDAGRPYRAAADLTGILRRREDRLGPRHPDTLAARHQLAFFTGEAGNPHAAAARFAALAADAASVLGPDHPDTLAARHALAHFTGEAGAPAEAARQLARLLTDRLRAQHPDDPRVLATRRGLLWYRADDPARAEARWAELLADTLRCLGPDDPHTLAVRGSRAALAARAGRTDEAAAAWESVTADRARVMGPAHPHTVHARLEWARALAGSGRPGPARALLTRTLGDAGTLLEPGHRHLRRARELLAELPPA